MAEANVYDADTFKQKITSQYTDVIGEKLGGKVLSFSDQWFADAENLIKPSAPIRQFGKFTPAGAWYDGWETRRHNTEPSDWVIIRLGVASAKVIGAEVDTAFFDGNHAPAISIEGTFVSDESQLSHAEWTEIISKVECGPTQRHFFARSQITADAFTHVRLHMYPDGGIARFRLYGSPVPVFPLDLDTEIDLAHVSSGGVAVAYSDQHFGTVDNLLIPGRGKDMSDGWETSRSRTPNHVDWVIVKLGAAGILDRVVVDTANFIGNYPQSIRVEGLLADNDETITNEDSRWKTIVDQTKVGPNKEHVYSRPDLKTTTDIAFSHVKLVIIPDGGVKRFRVFGRRVPANQ